MKLLIIRFSSFGDLVQTSAVLKTLKEQRPDIEIHWLVRSDMEGVIKNRSEISKIWSLDRKSGITGLMKMAKALASENFTYLYDAHGSMRSTMISFYLRMADLSLYYKLRSKYRLKRFLLFKLGVNLFPRPYKSMLTYWEPLKELLKLEGTPDYLEKTNFDGDPTYRDSIILAPSAAWIMKRWPLENFKRLITILSDEKFIVLGGKGDDFCEELREVDPKRVLNLAGKLTLDQSSALVANGRFIISADTGLIHVADVYGTPGIMLTGPTAFGGTTFPQISILKADLDCMPCTKDGRGSCSAPTYQKCMLEITPEMVAKKVKERLSKLD